MKQQEWIARIRITRGVMLAVGFAFDANEGTRKDETTRPELVLPPV
jgi:hypothetical protein